MEFVWPIRVYYEDTDAGGVVYYANYLGFLERARTEWLRSIGVEQDRLIRDQGVAFVVRRAEVDYLRPARFNDLLQVRTKVVECGRTHFSFDQSIHLEGEDAALCRGLTRVACIDAARWRPARIPDTILEQL